MKNLKVTAEYKGHPIVSEEPGEYQYNERHLANNLELMENMTQRHNKVFSYRMDLRMPKDVKLDKAPKQIAQNFMSTYCKKLARQKIDSEYIVKVERETSSDSPHFSIQMFVDGNKVKDHDELITKGEKLLADQLGLTQSAKGILSHPHQISKETEPAQTKTNGIMIRRNSDHFEEQFDKCFKQASSLSKQKSSDQVKSGERKVFYSRFRNAKSRSFE